MRGEAKRGVASTQCGLCYLYGIDVEVDYKGRFGSQQVPRTGVLRARSSILDTGARNSPERAPVDSMFEAVGKPEASTDAFAARVELGRIFSRGVGIPVDAKALQPQLS